MSRRPIEIRLGGYGPPTTSFSRALKLIGDRVSAALGDRVEVRYVWNIMDFGYRAEDILWLVESGVLTLGYQSTSYFTDRVPELGLLDLPFLFESGDAARAAMAASIIGSSAISRTASVTSRTVCGRCAGPRISRACAFAYSPATFRCAPSSCWARCRCAWI
jgi:TRAP-type C4-dicarboxylate transport system substrate-binding protein